MRLFAISILIIWTFPLVLLLVSPKVPNSLSLGFVSVQVLKTSWICHRNLPLCVSSVTRVGLILLWEIFQDSQAVLTEEVVRATVRPSTRGWAPPLVIVLVVVGASSSSSSHQSCADRHAVHISQFCSWRLRACWSEGCWGEDGVEEGDLRQKHRKSDFSDVKRLMWCQSCGDGKTTSMRRMRGVWRRTDKMYISDLSEDDIEIAIKVWTTLIHKTPKKHGWHWK